MSGEAETEYFSKDFEWEELKAEVEGDPSLIYHLLPFHPASLSSSLPEANSEAWSRFHMRHATGKFFKVFTKSCFLYRLLIQERRYLLKEFPELVSCAENSKVLEVGCGNGSTALPILRGNKTIIVFACDCSLEAIQSVKRNLDASGNATIKHRFCTFLTDFSINPFPKWLVRTHWQEIVLRMQHGSWSDASKESGLQCGPSYSSNGCNYGTAGLDFVTLIFTLSAVPLERMPNSIKECFTVLRPGGMLLFRDYGLYDMSMLRFKPDKRVGYREYMRSDGTRSYFFSLENVRDLFVGAGFTEIELAYCCIKSENRGNGKSMQRVWVHGKFQRPESC